MFKSKPSCVGQQDLALHRKYIELIFGWVPSEVDELLEVSNCKKWIVIVAQRENELDLFSNQKFLDSFAEVLVELICDQDYPDPWRHKLLCSKLNDKQMEEFSKLVKLREERKCAKLLEKAADDDDGCDSNSEEQCCRPPLEGEKDTTIFEHKFVQNVGDGSPDNPASRNPPPHSSREGSPPSKVVATYNEGLDMGMGRLEIEEGNKLCGKNTGGFMGLSVTSGTSGGRAEENTEMPYYARPSPSAPVLTPEMIGVVEEALKRSPTECLVNGFGGLKYTQRDLAVMNDEGARLNDRNIDFYLKLIKERSGSFEGFLKVYVYHLLFYTMLLDNEVSFEEFREAIGDEDLTAFDLVFFPVNLNDHWRLAVVDFGEKKLKCLDSVRGNEKENKVVLQHIHGFVTREYQRRNPREDIQVFLWGWDLDCVTDERIPQQGNEIDSDVFLLQFAEYLSRGMNHFDFGQENVPYFRKKMMYEILTKRIFPQ